MRGAVQKIKKNLIQKAKLKKEYAKLKKREPVAPARSVYDRDGEENDENEQGEEQLHASGPRPEPTLEPHPDRLKLLERDSPSPEPSSVRDFQPKPKRPRPQTYKKETDFARKRKEEAEARQRARQEADKARQQKLAERELFRKTMAKARNGGPHGQRKLGRESTVLLAKVKRLVGDA